MSAACVVRPIKGDGALKPYLMLKQLSNFFEFSQVAGDAKVRLQAITTDGSLGGVSTTLLSLIFCFT